VHSDELVMAIVHVKVQKDIKLSNQIPTTQVFLMGGGADIFCFSPSPEVQSVGILFVCEIFHLPPD
jgi:hypothetical protein